MGLRDHCWRRRRVRCACSQVIDGPCRDGGRPGSGAGTGRRERRSGQAYGHAHPARPARRGDGGAGGRARLRGGRRPSRLPARRRLAPHLLRPLRRPRRLVWPTRTTRRSAGWSATSRRRSREAGAEWEDRAVAATQALLGAWEADRVLAHLCLVVRDRRRRRDARRCARRRSRARRGCWPTRPTVAVLGELTLTSAIGGVWEPGLRRADRRPRRLDRPTSAAWRST